MEWIRNPERKPGPGPNQRMLWNHKYDAQQNYTIKEDGMLYRVPTVAERKRAQSYL